MALIDTLTGIDKVVGSDREYTVTANVVVGAGIDDPDPFSIFVCTSGGLLRFGDGCTTTFDRCQIIERDDALALGVNYNQFQKSRFFGGATCTPVFKGTIFVQENTARSDWDVSDDGAAPSFIKADDGTPCYLYINTGDNQWNHIASQNAIINGFTIDDNRFGGDMEFVIPPNISDMTIKDNDPGSNDRHVVVLVRDWNDNDTYSISKLSARNIATWEGNATRTLQLIDPVTDLARSTADAPNSQQGILEVYRTYSLSCIDAITKAVVSPNIIVTATSDNAVRYDQSLVSGSFSNTLFQYLYGFESAVKESDNNYRRVLYQYGYTPSVNTFNIEWNPLSPDGFSEGTVLLFTKAGITEPTSATVAAYTSVENMNKLFDAVHYLDGSRVDRHNVGSDDFIAEGSKINLGSSSLILTAAVPSAFPVEVSGSSYTAYTNGNSFSLSSKIEFETTGSVTFSNASVVPDNITITGDMVLSEVTNLNGVTVTGSLTMETAGTYNFTGCNINEVINTSGGNIIIERDVNTVITLNTGPNITINVAGQTVQLIVTVADVTTGSPIEGARVRLTADSGGPETLGTVLLEGLTNASGVIQTNYTYTSDQPVTGTVRKSSSAPYYKAGVLSGSITTNGYDVPINMILD